MTIRKMVTLRHAHLPRILTNCIFSLLSCCSLSTAGVVNPTARAADKHPGLVCCGWKGTYFSPPSLSLYFSLLQIFFQKKKKKQKAKGDHNKINAWNFSHTKISDIREQLKDPESCYIHAWAVIFLFLYKAKPRAE